MRSWRLWTPEDDALLRDLYGERSTAEIAEMTSHTPEAIYSRARKLGLQWHRGEKREKRNPLMSPSTKYIAYVMIGGVKRILKQSHSRRLFARWKREHRGTRGMICEIVTIKE